MSRDLLEWASPYQSTLWVVYLSGWHNQVTDFFPPGVWSERMVPSQRHSSHDLGLLWLGRNRSFFQGGVNSLSSMVFLHGGIGYTGIGHIGSSFAKGPPIHFFRPFSDPAYSSESSRGGPQDVADDSVLANMAMVPTATESVSWHPMVSGVTCCLSWGGLIGHLYF